MRSTPSQLTLLPSFHLGIPEQGAGSTETPGLSKRNITPFLWSARTFITSLCQLIGRMLERHLNVQFSNWAQTPSYARKRVSCCSGWTLVPDVTAAQTAAIAGRRAHRSKAQTPLALPTAASVLVLLREFSTFLVTKP